MTIHMAPIDSPRFSATYANAKAPSVANNSHPSLVVMLLIYSPILKSGIEPPANQ
jgi:hypothetical protein